VNNLPLPAPQRDLANERAGGRVITKLRAGPFHAIEGAVEEEEEEPAPKPRAFSFSAASIAKARPLSGMVGELSTVKEKET
tara:strand:+ start:542 stop:784 length:243 start_codon:yes stop_codon:yes gene_type:complete